MHLAGYHIAYLWDFFNDQLFWLGGTEQIPVGGNAAAYANQRKLAIANSGTALYLYNLATGRVIRQFCGAPLGYMDKG